jgi:DNA-binding transcriptional ArsR family regulator
LETRCDFSLIQCNLVLDTRRNRTLQKDPMKTNEQIDLAARAKVFKALGHPSRLLMVEALGQGERCVCELRELVGSDISTVSKHLSVLKEAGIVHDERRGTSIYYSLRMQCVTTFLGCVRRFFDQQLEEQFIYLEDLRKKNRL